MRSEQFFHKGRQYRVWWKHFSQLESEIYDYFRHAISVGQIKGYLGNIMPKWDTEISHLTICTIENNNRRPLAVGYAFCSLSDQFSRKIGRKISFSRALKELDKVLNI